LSSQINYTLANFAGHSERFGHDAINRYLAGDSLPPSLVWENVKGQVVQTLQGLLVFDDVVLDHRYAQKIDLITRRRYVHFPQKPGEPAFSGSVKMAVCGMKLAGPI
jgi:hypothetical protein